jgi:hypothetical protein
MKLLLLIFTLFSALNAGSWRGFVADIKNEAYRREKAIEELKPMVRLPFVQQNEVSEQVNLPVPFAMQAPFSDWSMPYQEACEEAALILTSRYFSNEKVDKKIMKKEILALIEWEKKKFGLFTDTNLNEIQIMAEEYFKLETKIDDDVSIANIKKQLSAGNLVLAPAAGRELKNPFFKQPGPLYHLLLIRGYEDDNFIVNDVGIGRGFGYKYKMQTLINAIHDLPLAEDGTIFRPYDEKVDDVIKVSKMKEGKKRILIVSGRLTKIKEASKL